MKIRATFSVVNSVTPAECTNRRLSSGLLSDNFPATPKGAAEKSQQNTERYATKQSMPKIIFFWLLLSTLLFSQYGCSLKENESNRLESSRKSYMMAIKEKVERNWKKPASKAVITDCEVEVSQGPGGIILEVIFRACEGNSNEYRHSIKQAIYDAEPLPQPSDIALFDRHLIFIFEFPK